jgi:hypothetical protein
MDRAKDADFWSEKAAEMVNGHAGKHHLYEIRRRACASNLAQHGLIEARCMRKPCDIALRPHNAGKTVANKN